MNPNSAARIVVLISGYLAIGATMAAPVWRVEEVTDAAFGCSTAFLPDGSPAVVYSDSVSGDLIYAVRDGDIWQAETVAPDAIVTSTNCLAVDTLGRPAVVFEDRLSGELKFARHDGSDWNVEVVDDVDSEPDTSANYQAVLVFSPGGTPAMAYRYKNNAPTLLKYAQSGDSGWNITAVDGLGEDGPFPSSPSSPSLVFSPGGEPAVSFCSSTATSSSVKFARMNGGSWVVEKISDIDISWTVDIESHVAFAPGGQPVVAFTDGDDLLLKFAEYDGLAWNITTALTVESTCFAKGLSYDSQGRPMIAFYHFRDSPQNPFLGIARHDGLLWNVYEPDPGAELYYAVSFARGASGHLGIAYIQKTPPAEIIDYAVKFVDTFAGMEVFEGAGTDGTKRENGQAPFVLPTLPEHGTGTVAFTVRNNGFEPMDLITRQLAGADAASFVLPAAVSELAAGEAATFPLIFAPETAGGHIASLTVACAGSPGSPVVIPLTGQSVAASGGDAFGFGDNDFGAVGDGSTGPKLSPSAVLKTGALSGRLLTDIATGEGHTIARDTEGKVFAWGYNATGQLGDGTQADSPVPMAVDMGALPSGTVTAISCGGGAHNLALDRDGKVFAWGDNGQGQLGVGDFAPRTIPTRVVDAGALAGQTVVAVVAGHDNSFALTYDGRVFAWGYNLGANTGAPGKLGDGTATSFRHSPVEVDASGALAGKFIASLSASSTHTLALSDNGELYAWGENDAGQLGDGTAISRLSPVSVLMAGSLSGKTITGISAGPGFSLAVASDGSIHAWGDNSFGQFGNGTTVSSQIPVAVETGGVLSGKIPLLIEAGTYGAHLVANDGKLYAWGQATLGNGTTDLSLTPLAIDANGIPGARTVFSLSRSRPDTLFLATALPVPPTVANTTATEIGVASAQLSAVVLSDGGSPVTQRGFVIAPTSQNPDPMIGGHQVTLIAAGSGTGTFGAVAGTLSPATPYTFRAYATNMDGATGYSDVSAFTTATSPLETWRQFHFPGSTASTGPGANQAAPRGDGIPNLIKYALGMDPALPGVLPITLTAGAEEISYTYTPSAEALAAGVVLTVEFSSSLEAESWGDESVNQGSASAPGQPVTASRAKPPTGPAFLRLKAEIP
jgi:alpha-tubulin suppressor-like RCC1 family protein